MAFYTVKAGKRSLKPSTVFSYSLLWVPSHFLSYVVIVYIPGYWSRTSVCFHTDGYITASKCTRAAQIISACTVVIYMLAYWIYCLGLTQSRASMQSKYANIADGSDCTDAS